MQKNIIPSFFYCLNTFNRFFRTHTYKDFFSFFKREKICMMTILKFHLIVQNLIFYVISTNLSLRNNNPFWKTVLSDRANF